MVKLKSIDITDAELLSKLSSKTFVQAYENTHSVSDLHAYCNANYSIDSAEALLNESAVEALIAFNDSDPAGFYVIKHHQCPIKLLGMSTELKQIYVLSAYFGSGMGSKLFDSVIEQAVKNESKWLWLCVSDINHRAQAFYNKLGFSKIGNGPELIVGCDKLSSSIMILDIEVLN